MRTKRVLFLCTGNYYRSRFAEELFNHHAQRLGMSWRAFSCALAIERGSSNVGAISRYTVEALADRGIKLPDPIRPPLQCSIGDFDLADVVIAMKEVEHRELIKARFAAWGRHVIYWHVHDIDAASPEETIEVIDQLVRNLVGDLHLS